MSGLKAVSADPRADAIADLLRLVAGADKEHVKQVVAAIDPLVLPAFLELGSILFFAFAFPRNARRNAAMDTNPKPLHESEPATLARTYTKQEALSDLRRLREAGSGRWLASRWGIDPGTASRWLAEFEEAGAIQRNRTGKSKAIVALSSGRR